MSNKTEIDIRPAGRGWMTVYIDTYATHHEFILSATEFDEWKAAFRYEHN